jgi:hypothetical protein
MDPEDRESVQLEGLRDDIQTICAFLSPLSCYLVCLFPWFTSCLLLIDFASLHFWGQKN